MEDATILKKRAADYAVSHFVKSGMAIGLGTGTTAIWAVRNIAQKYQSGELVDIRCAATGPGTALEAAALGMPLYDLNSSHVQSFDVTIDGADEYDDEYNLIKGGGACLFHEKIVAYSTDTFICIANTQKRSEYLGKNFPVPVEVAPVALSRVTCALQAEYNACEVLLRRDARKVGPWITEEGNYIVDVVFPMEFVPSEYEREIVQLVGVIECGIFSKSRFIKPPVLCIACDDGSVSVHERSGAH